MMQRPAQRLARTLKERSLTLALAESITCGLISHKIGSVSNTSEVFLGCIVCYDEKVKTNLLKVSKKLIEKHTAESAEVTVELARKLSKLIKADICAAVTGLASPGGSEAPSKLVGTVFFAVAYKRKIHSLQKRFYGRPLEVKKKAAKELFNFISSIIDR